MRRCHKHQARTKPAAHCSGVCGVAMHTRRTHLHAALTRTCRRKQPGDGPEGGAIGKGDAVPPLQLEEQPRQRQRLRRVWCGYMSNVHVHVGVCPTPGTASLPPGAAAAHTPRPATARPACTRAQCVGCSGTRGGVRQLQGMGTPLPLQRWEMEDTPHQIYARAHRDHRSVRCA
jgi:hypothetical protein